MKLDAKFYGEIRKAKDDSIVPDDEYIVFLAKDDAFANTLPKYRQECVDQGCDKEQIAMVDEAIRRVALWRKLHPSRLKKPDAAGEKTLYVP